MPAGSADPGSISYQNGLQHRLVSGSEGVHTVNWGGCSDSTAFVKCRFYSRERSDNFLLLTLITRKLDINRDGISLSSGYTD